MICDDDPDILRAYRIAFHSKFHVVTAVSGNQCLRTYSETKSTGTSIDVLLLDYRLGDMSGDVVACKIRDLNGTKTILISAYDIDPNLLMDLKQKSCIASFVKKPISLSSLVATVEKTLKD